jgi:hypothetical protein
VQGWDFRANPAVRLQMKAVTVRRHGLDLRRVARLAQNPVTVSGRSPRSRLLGKDMSATSIRHSRVKSSTVHGTRRGRPSVAVSDKNSNDQRWLVASGEAIGLRVSSTRLRLPPLCTCSCSAARRGAAYYGSVPNLHSLHAADVIVPSEVSETPTGAYGSVSACSAHRITWAGPTGTIPVGSSQGWLR